MVSSGSISPAACHFRMADRLTPSFAASWPVVTNAVTTDHGTGAISSFTQVMGVVSDVSAIRVFRVVCVHAWIDRYRRPRLVLATPRRGLDPQTCWRSKDP